MVGKFFGDASGWGCRGRMGACSSVSEAGVKRLDGCVGGDEMCERWVGGGLWVHG